MVVTVLIVVLVIIVILIIIFITLHNAKRRKCKFDELYKNVSTSYIQVNGQCHKKMKNKKLRLIFINEICYNMMADKNIMAALSMCMSDLYCYWFMSHYYVCNI